LRYINKNKIMAIVFKPGKKPASLSTPPTPTIFLAGSIEMGKAEKWQDKIEQIFYDETVRFFNPRRDDWDSSWSHESEQFNTQVNWELNALDESDIIFMYFSPETKSPISLLELGLYANSNKMIVVCPDEFWRKGNVSVVCTRYNIPMFNTFEEGVFALRTKIKKLQKLY
jgi:hypothetical protein